MFSMRSKDEYDDEKGKSEENLLDILSHAGVHVLWRDNNSDSKGVALRVQYEDYKSAKVDLGRLVVLIMHTQCDAF